MTIPDAEAALAKQSFVEQAGAAPLDSSGIPCYQITLNDFGLLNEGTQQKIETIIDENTSASVVQTSTDTVDGEATVWAWTYSPLAEFTVQGVDWHALEATEHAGVTAIMQDLTGATPESGIKKFKWNQIPINKEDILD